MKRFFWICTIGFWASLAGAQTNPVIRLAIVAESPEALPEADLLTVEFSKNSQVQLLERAEIDRVYQEQGLSAANRDCLKLGRLLGADGLLLVESVRAEENVRVPSAIPLGASPLLELNLRLTAVKPGVVLASGSFSVAAENLPEWSSSYAHRLASLLPKLTVLAKDAVPISVVNLRSAITSSDAPETERELKALTIQRLSREPQLFVLERQRMDLLSSEKGLQADESAFWDGSYVLEGVVDPNGYAQEALVIRARLTPPRGSPPLEFEVSGARTNLAEAVNRLAVKVAERLQMNPSASEWNAAEEAEQYFQEAQWALRWEIYPEAQTAAESAWALGKRDLDCALVRTRSYVSQVPKLAPGNVIYYHNRKRANYVHAGDLPKTEDCENARRALECYYEFMRMSPRGTEFWGDWHKSEWYGLGLEALAVSTDVLRHFHLFPENQKPIAEKLAELRGLSRLVADQIAQCPSAHDSYWVGERVVSGEELDHNFSSVLERRWGMAAQPSPPPNIFEFMLQRGCFWQERPQDTLALYRELMSSPLFFRLHANLWFRDSECPRLAAWDTEGEKDLPLIWRNFVNELCSSTNYFLRFEGLALRCADAKTAAGAAKPPGLAGSAEPADPNAGGKSSCADLLQFISTNYGSIVANNGNLPNYDWELYLLLGEKTEYASQFAALQRDYRNQLDQKLKADADRAVFEKQKQYLASFTPYNMAAFDALFVNRDYTKTEAGELKRLIAAYKSNLLAQVPTNGSPFARFGADNTSRMIEFFLERRLDSVLNAPAPTVAPTSPSPVAATPKPPPPSQATPPAARLVPQGDTNVVANVLEVTRFLPIVWAGPTNEPIMRITITAHHWVEGKLLLDLQCLAWIYAVDQQGQQTNERTAIFPAIAMLDSSTEQWRVIRCPAISFDRQNWFYNHTTLCGGAIFTVEGDKLAKFDLAKNAWQVLNLPDLGNSELFTVNGRLYAAKPDLIAEILDGGSSTRILASNRRQPAVSVLDTEDLGTPALFAGPGQTLRAAIGNKVVAWAGTDWRAVCSAPATPVPPVISDGGALFLSLGGSFPDGIWRLGAGGNQMEYLLRQDQQGGFGPAATGAAAGTPEWTRPKKLSRRTLPFASRGADLYLLADHSRSEPVIDETKHLIVGQRILSQNGYHAELLCFSPNYTAPQSAFLRFAGDDATLPIGGNSHGSGFMMPALPSGWFCFAGDRVYFGRETADALPISGSALQAGQPRAGVWVLPVSAIETAVARQKAEQQEQRHQNEAAAGQTTKNLLAKYDRNHNGVIDPDEREDALQDTNFIKTQLEVIDANHNGWLEAAELAWFDANRNGILEPKEQAAIGSAQYFLAQRLLEQFDSTGEGSLRQPDYNMLITSTLHANPNADSELQFPHADENHDGRIDLSELEHLLRRHTENQVRRTGRQSVGFNFPPGMGGIPRQSPAERFKSDVELYWQNAGGGIQRPSLGTPELRNPASPQTDRLTQ